MGPGSSIGILGGNGFLGSNLASYFRTKECTVTAISRDTYVENIGKEFDVFINANGNSRRFWANQHPQEDYEASVVSVEKSIQNFGFKKYFFISSSDVYPNHHDSEQTKESQTIDENKLEPYGLHKLQAETAVKKLPDYIILRCSAMIGPGLQKGLIKDILDGTDLFITKDSRLQFITTTEIGGVIQKIADDRIRNTIFNCGGKGSVGVTEILKIFGKSVVFRDEAQKQEYEMNVHKLDKLVILKTSQKYLKEFYEEQA